MSEHPKQKGTLDAIEMRTREYTEIVENIVAKTSKKIIYLKGVAGITLVLAAALLCTQFSEYLPTTADDYSSLFNGWKDVWIGQNRLS